MGKTLRRNAGSRGEGGATAAQALKVRVLRRAASMLRAWVLPFALQVIAGSTAPAQEIAAPIRLDSGRFTFVLFPKDSLLARVLLLRSLESDTFPGLPRPRQHVTVAVAPDFARFREWIGPNVPEWGAAVAFPGLERIVIQGAGAGSDAGDPRVVLRHELAHLALHEYMGDLPPRWFDEGYASISAREWGREAVLAANLLLLLRGVPSLDSLDDGFSWSSSLAQATYALSHMAVAELHDLDPARGLSLFFRYWRETGSMERAVRQAYGITVDAFETRWKRRVRARYGLIAIFTDLSIVGAGVMFIFLPVYLARRRRMRARLAALKQVEAEAERREAELMEFERVIAGLNGAQNVTDRESQSGAGGGQ